MAINKFVSADQAAALIKDGDTVGLIGGGGGMMEATCLHAAVEQRFLETGQPKGLTVVHALGIGDQKERGLNRFAHEGMVKRVIGGHWVWSPRMQELARAEKIEAYSLPGGVVVQLFREIGSGRLGLFTHVGLGTFVGPRQEGGRMNRSAKETLVEVMQIDGQELLRYKPFPVQIAILRGSYADAEGNVSLEAEAAKVDFFCPGAGRAQLGWQSAGASARGSGCWHPAGARGADTGGAGGRRGGGPESEDDLRPCL